MANLSQLSELLQDQDVPTDSYISAIRRINELPEKTKKQYETMISQLVGFKFTPPPTTDDGKPWSALESRYTYLYLVQTILRDDISELPTSDILQRALTRAQAYLRSVPWLTAGEDNPDQPKRRKVGKIDTAYDMYVELRNVKTRKEIITKIQTELNMSRSGATTYYHTVKKRFEQM